MPTLAWFRPAPPAPTPLDDTAALIRELSPSFRVDGYDAASAHQFVFRHARRPYDLCVYELANTPAHAFVWPYLLHYPGVLHLRSPAADRSRASALARASRAPGLMAELDFSGCDLLRAPVLASRLVVTTDDELASRLQQSHPDATVRRVPLGFGRPGEPSPRRHEGPLRFAAPGATHRDLIDRAAQRAAAAGARLESVRGGAEDAFGEADVILTLEWPPSNGEPPLTALAAMAHGRAVVVFETEGTARWPALDPQTWQSRALAGADEPFVVSIDPRDEEHSLVLVMRRLAADRALVDRLAASGHAWWRHHATIAHAAAGWRQALEEAVPLSPPPRPGGWPAHLDADGTQHARRVLEEVHVSVDFLR